jgi:peptidoglycan/LPS O-acetylase OafA/YrhL
VRQVADRLDALTGLRFVAAAAVLASHLQLWLHRADWNLGTLGSAAVGFFFVLSGFILSHVYRGGGTSIEAGAFYRARFARIWPVHAACLVLMVAANGTGPSPDPWAATHRIAEHALLLQAWTTDVHWAHSLNGPAWSLSVEAFFYALFPWFVRLGTRSLVILLTLAWCGNVAVYAMLDSTPTTEADLRSMWECIAVTAPPLRLQEFLLGICAHALWQNRRTGCPSRSDTWLATVREALACVAVFVSFRAFSECGLGPAWIEAPAHEASRTAMARGPGLSFAFAALVYVCADGRGLLSRLLACRPMRYLGEISYVFYLVHTFALLLTTRHFETQGLELAWVPQAISSTAIIIGASALLHATVELPLRQALVAREAGARERARIAARVMLMACRARAFLMAMATGFAGMAWVGLAFPGVMDIAGILAERSPDELRGVRFGSSCELHGATTTFHPPQFRAWIALREAPGARHTTTIEARAKDGSLVHAFANRIRQQTGPDGSAWTVIDVSEDLPNLLGSSALTLTIRDRDGAVLSPSSGPVSLDGQMLELLRLHE